MPTNDPREWIRRDSRNVVITTFGEIPLNLAPDTWYYTRSEMVEKYDELIAFASVDGPVGSLGDLSLRIQASDGMTRLKHYSFIDLPGLDTGQGVNPYTIAGAVSTAQLPNPVNQQQVITFAAGTSGGHYTLGFGNQTSASQTYSTSATTAAAVQSVLQALTTIGTALNNNSRAIVTGPNGGPFTVQLFDTLEYQDNPLIVATNVDLTGGGSPGVSVAAKPTGPLIVNSARRCGDEVRLGVKWHTAGPSTTNLIMTLKAKG